MGAKPPPALAATNPQSAAAPATPGWNAEAKSRLHTTGGWPSASCSEPGLFSGWGAERAPGSVRSRDSGTGGVLAGRNKGIWVVEDTSKEALRVATRQSEARQLGQLGQQGLRSARLTPRHTRRRRWRPASAAGPQLWIPPLPRHARWRHRPRGAAPPAHGRQGSGGRGQRGGAKRSSRHACSSVRRHHACCGQAQAAGHAGCSLGAVHRPCARLSEGQGHGRTAPRLTCAARLGGVNCSSTRAKSSRPSGRAASSAVACPCTLLREGWRRGGVAVAVAVC